MFRTPIREDRNANKLESKNELPYTTNLNCVSPSSGEEEQKQASLRGGELRGVLLLRLTNREEDGLEDIKIRLKRHNMALNEAACSDGTSQNNKMRIGEDKEMNGNERNTKEIKTSKKQRSEERTNATLPIQDNVVLVREGGERFGENFGTLFTSTSPRDPVVPHGLVLDIGESVEPTISLEIVTHVFKVRGPDIQNGLITYKHLDEELVSLHKI